MRKKDWETLGFVAFLASVSSGVVVIFALMLFFAMETMK
jgi:hypothetical protein